MHARPHVAGIDEHRRHVPFAQFVRECPRQQLQGRFACAVRAPAGIRAVRGVARDVDDQAAPFGQQRNRQLNQGNRRAGIDREDPPEALHVEVDERADAAELRRVVHEHIQAAERAGGVTSRARTAASVTSPSIGTTREPCAASDSRNSTEWRRVTAADDQVMVALGQDSRNHLAEAAACARDEATRLFSRISIPPARSRPPIATAPRISINLQVHLKSSGRCRTLKP